jgi:hypothetical protein
MQASNPPRTHTPTPPPRERRPTCRKSPPTTDFDELTVTVKILPLGGDGAERIAEHQLAVIARLLRCAVEAQAPPTRDQSE